MNWRAALIGCGMIGSEATAEDVIGVCTHAGAYVACPATQLVAVCDANPASAQRCAERWDVVQGYQDARQMLAEEQPQLVSICTPDSTHAELLQLILDSASIRAVLAEKPIALELSQARELVQLARERNVVLAVNYSRRYAANHRRLRQILAEGRIGDLMTVSGCYSKGTLHNATHWFDAARFLGGEITRVQGFDLRGETGDDPSLDAILHFANGATGHLQAVDARSGTLFEMDLLGTQGRVRIVEHGQRIETYCVVESTRFAGHRYLERGEDVEGGARDLLLHAVEDLVHCLQTGARPQCSGEDALATLHVALAVRESSRRCASVEIAEFAC